MWYLFLFLCFFADTGEESSREGASRARFKIIRRLNKTKQGYVKNKPSSLYHFSDYVYRGNGNGLFVRIKIPLSRGKFCSIFQIAVTINFLEK